MGCLEDHSNYDSGAWHEIQELQGRVKTVETQLSLLVSMMESVAFGVVGLAQKLKEAK